MSLGALVGLLVFLLVAIWMREAETIAGRRRVRQRSAVRFERSWSGRYNLHGPTSNRVASGEYQPLCFSQHGRAMLLHHGEHILAEMPKTMRRFAMFMLMLTISIPVFFAGLLVVLWHLAK
jgi:hypothetical protein